MEEDKFEAHVGPVRDALLRLVAAAEGLAGSAGMLPAADSLAMREVAGEAQYKGSKGWGNLPATDAHNATYLLLLGADDIARAVCSLLAPGPPPVFAHVILARAGLEHAGRAWWLLDPTLDLRHRIARGVNERLNSLAEQKRLPGKASEIADTRSKQILSEADRLGFTKVKARKGQPPWLLEPRPSSTALLRKLLQTGEDVTLGAVVYNYFSAVSHGTLYGLTQSISADEAKAGSTSGQMMAPVVTNSGQVCTVLAALVLGIGNACQSRNTLFGWKSDEWNNARVAALTATRRAFGV